MMKKGVMGTKEHSGGKTQDKSSREPGCMGKAKSHLMHHMKEVDIKLVKGHK